MSLINCGTNLILTCLAICFIITHGVDGQVPGFTLTNTKRHVPIVTLSTQNNGTLLRQLKSGFERTINWDKSQSKLTIQTKNRYFHYLTDPSLQGVNRLFYHL